MDVGKAQADGVHVEKMASTECHKTVGKKQRTWDDRGMVGVAHTVGQEGRQGMPRCIYDTQSSMHCIMYYDIVHGSKLSWCHRWVQDMLSPEHLHDSSIIVFGYRW